MRQEFGHVFVNHYMVYSFYVFACSSGVLWYVAGVFAFVLQIDLEKEGLSLSLALYGIEHRPRRRGLKARGDQSLSLTNVRELLPQSLCGR